MSKTWYALDNEFAVATGDNVNVGDNTARFDNPPAGSKDLVISSLDGDSDPKSFMLGDHYEVSWGGNGASFLSDATVIRSDLAPGDGGIVVFEGIDENGDLAQVIWTPDFDLEDWYNTNYNPSAEPQFYVEDMNSSYSHTVVCFAMGTRMATPHGYRAIERIKPGDLVLTKDAGAQPVRRVSTNTHIGHGNAAPVHFDKGSIANTRPLRLSQQHRVLVRSPELALYFGLEEALVPAKALINGTTVRKAPCPTISYIHVMLDQHHILFAEGAECESLFREPPAIAHARHRNRPQPSIPARPFLTYREGRLLTRQAPAPALSCFKL